MIMEEKPSNPIADKTKASLQDKKATGGKNALEGFDFQRRYAFVKLVESLQTPGFTAILIEGAEDVEVRFENQGEVERRAIQVKNHRVTTAEAKEIITNLVKLDTDSPNTWTSFVIACTELDETLKTIDNLLEDYRGLNSGRFYSEKNNILTTTRDDLESRIREAGFQQAKFVLDRVSFEPNLVAYASDEWVSARVLNLLQTAFSDINYPLALDIYRRLCELIRESTRKPITLDEMMKLIETARAENIFLMLPEFLTSLPKENDRITGSILFEDGRPVENARVRVIGLGLDPIVTGSDGYFEFIVDDQPSWTIQASYKEMSVNTTIKKEQIGKPAIIKFPHLACFSIDSPIENEEIPLGEKKERIIEGSFPILTAYPKLAETAKIELEVYKSPEGNAIKQSGTAQISINLGKWYYVTAKFTAEGIYSIDLLQKC